MIEIIYSPFTPEQVEALNFYQQAGVWHESTCGNFHPEASPTLIAKEDGWHCPNCEYTQHWAHAFMTNRPFIEQRRLVIEQSVLNVERVSFIKLIHFRMDKN